MRSGGGPLRFQNMRHDRSEAHHSPMGGGFRYHHRGDHHLQGGEGRGGCAAVSELPYCFCSSSPSFRGRSEEKQLVPYCAIRYVTALHIQVLPLDARLTFRIFPFSHTPLGKIKKLLCSHYSTMSVHHKNKLADGLLGTMKRLDFWYSPQRMRVISLATPPEAEV